MVEDQEKLLARFAQVKEWIQEANYWAKKEGSQFISDRHVRPRRPIPYLGTRDG